MRRELSPKKAVCLIYNEGAKSVDYEFSKGIILR